MSSCTRSFLGLLVLSSALVLLIPSSAAAAAPVIGEFIASPAAPSPGQVVRVTLRAHDPDCATSCTSGCGA